MVTLHIEHQISDYATWRAAFDAHADARHRAGVVAARVSQPIDDDRFIVVALDFESSESASSFLRFLEEQVWPSPTRAPALIGRPRATILEHQPEPGTDGP